MDGTLENGGLILRSDEDGIAVLTLNPAKSINALSEAMLSAMSEILDDIAADRSVKVVILRSGGNHFCAGHDLKEMTARRADVDGGFRYSPARNPCPTGPANDPSGPRTCMDVEHGEAKVLLVDTGFILNNDFRRRFAVPDSDRRAA